jgi:hypothetical protein
MPEECPTCQIVDCCGPTTIFGYSVTSGTLFLNQQTSLEFTCPAGFSCEPGIYTIVKGRIRFRVNTTNPPGQLSLQGCISLIVRPVPANSTPAEVAAIAQEMVNAAAAQLAQCTFNQTITGRRARFRNAEQFVTICSGGKVPDETTIPELPPALSVIGNELYVAASVFTSTVSQANANAQALSFLNSYRSILLTVISCGFYNTEQSFECPDTTIITVAAGEFFSAISQAAADALALAEAESQCPGVTLDWNDLVWDLFPVTDNSGSGFTGSVAGSGSGTGDSFGAIVSATGNFEYSGECRGTGTLTYTGPAVNCRLTITASSASSTAFAVGSCDVNISAPTPVGSFSCVNSGNSGEVGCGATFVDFTIPECLVPTLVTVVVLCTGTSTDTANSAGASVSGVLSVLP